MQQLCSPFSISQLIVSELKLHSISAMYGPVILLLQTIKENLENMKHKIFERKQSAKTIKPILSRSKRKTSPNKLTLITKNSSN